VRTLPWHGGRAVCPSGTAVRDAVHLCKLLKSGAFCATDRYRILLREMQFPGRRSSSMPAIRSCNDTFTIHQYVFPRLLYLKDHLEESVKTLMRRGYAALIFGAVVLLCAASPATSRAQDSAGASITGTVTDRGGRAVQNAAIVVENESTKLVQRAVTDDQGHFSVSNLPAGSYDLNIQASGFATATQTSLQLSAVAEHSCPAAGWIAVAEY
jgi:hypothetical protein